MSCALVAGPCPGASLPPAPAPLRRVFRIRVIRCDDLYSALYSQTQTAFSFASGILAAPVSQEYAAKITPCRCQVPTRGCCLSIGTSGSLSEEHLLISRHRSVMFLEHIVKIIIPYHFSQGCFPL